MIVEATGTAVGGMVTDVTAPNKIEEAMVAAIKEIEQESGRIWADKSLPLEERKIRINTINDPVYVRGCMKAAADKVAASG